MLRTCVGVLLALGIAIPVRAQSADVSRIPVTGEAAPGFEQFDDIMRNVLDRFGVPGASLAIARNGRLVLARGYGLANVQQDISVHPESLFLLASVSKSITAMTVLKLAETSRLSLEEPAFKRLAYLMPSDGRPADPRIEQITIRMLLNHSGGWDRKESGDPTTFGRRVQREFRLRRPVTPDDLIRYMLRRPLDFTPGSRSAYSNLGYVILGRIIERVTGEPYAAAVRRITLAPIGIERVRLDEPGHEYLPNEVHRYQPESEHAIPGGHPLMSDAAGGWLASSVDMVRFLVAVDRSGGRSFLSDELFQQMVAPPPPPIQPRPNGTWFGLGWDQVRRVGDNYHLSKNGGLPGITTFIQHQPDGVDWALLFNARPEHEEDEPALLGLARKEIERAIRETQRWPDVDLFPKYR